MPASYPFEEGKQILFKVHVPASYSFQDRLTKIFGIHNTNIPITVGTKYLRTILMYTRKQTCPTNDGEMISCRIKMKKRTMHKQDMKKGQLI